MGCYVLLREAALNGDVDLLYNVIGEDPHVLDRVDAIPFVETPLHVAASEGHTNFAVEIMRLKPSFSKKLDNRGLSPMHLALINQQTPTVLRLLETVDGADLVRVKGKDGVTPLHYVVEQGDLNLLHELLSFSPHSITDTTNQGETALHIAVKCGRTEVLNDLLAFLRRSWNKEALYREEKVLNWKDEKGYTVLHAAVEMNQFQMVKSLLKSNIQVNAINLSGLTALDIVDRSEPVNTEMKDLLIQAGALDCHSIRINRTPSTKQLSFKSSSFFENIIQLLEGQKTSISTESRDALLVAAALVATTTFQAVLSPPGGLRQADSGTTDALPFSKVGKVVMKEWLYMIFLIFNGTSFWVTITTIFLLLPPGFYGRLLTASLALLSACYLFISTIISPSLNCALVNIGLFALFIMLLLLGLVLLSHRRLFLSIRKLCSCSK